jgi:hypothetical protein
VPHLRAGPSHRGEPHADSTALLGFRLPHHRPWGASAHLTTRTSTWTDATPAVTSHMPSESTENWPTAPGGGGGGFHGQRLTRDRRPPGARRAASRVIRERALHLTAVRSVIQAGLAKLAAVSGSPTAANSGSLTCTSFPGARGAKGARVSSERAAGLTVSRPACFRVGAGRGGRAGRCRRWPSRRCAWPGRG